MKIDSNAGSIALPEIGAVILPALTRAQFLATSAFSEASESVRNEPWCSYRLPGIPQPHTDTELIIVLQFHGESLVWLSLCHDAARFGNSWADASEERELARKVFHDRWLAGSLRLRAGKHAWGEVSSFHDAKSGGSSIIVRYADSGENGGG